MISDVARRHRAKASGVTLSSDDTMLVKGMLIRGDRQHDIAAWFGVNAGRIAEIAIGKSFAWVKAAEGFNLPPVGPYPSGKRSIEAQVALDEALNALSTVQASLTRSTQSS